MSANPPTPPAAAPPATPPAEPPATPPATSPARTAADLERENELLRAQVASREKDRDIAKLKKENETKDKKLNAAMEGLRAAGLLEGDDADPKALVEKQQKEARSKERRDSAIERAALKKLIPTGLGEDDADLILGKALRDPRVTFDEATGAVSGLEDVFKALKPTIERLSGKPGAPPPPATPPPAPPNPGMSATPPGSDFTSVKTARDFMMLKASEQEAYEAKYPAQAAKFEAEFRRDALSSRNRIQMTPAASQAPGVISRR